MDGGGQVGDRNSQLSQNKKVVQSRKVQTIKSQKNVFWGARVSNDFSEKTGPKIGHACLKCKSKKTL